MVAIIDCEVTDHDIYHAYIKKCGSHASQEFNRPMQLFIGLVSCSTFSACTITVILSNINLFNNTSSH